ncbi:iduronate 2-sulfatase-like [Ciona intestinalis]
MNLYVLGLLLLGVANIESVADSRRPNVLFLVIDDLRPALGCYDYPKIFSPNIDKLASFSMKFENAHIQQAVCGPSRTSFLTSRRPDTTRLYDFGSYWRTHAGNYTSLPQHFKENGYFTYSIGKVFHPGICSNYNDDYPLSWSLPAYHPPTQKYKMKQVCPGPDGKLHMNLLCPVNVTTQPEHSLPDIQSAGHAVEMLQKFSNNKSQPFFLAVGFHKPHIPYKFPEQYLDLYPISEIDLAPNPFIPKELPPVAFSPYTQMRIREDVKSLNLSFPFGPIPYDFQRKIRQHYYSSVTYMDSMVGKVLQQLEQSGFADTTIITLIGDHGWSLGEHGDWCKYENFEVTTRIPMLVHVPGMTDVNEEKKAKFEYVDVFNEKHHKSAKSGPHLNVLVEAVDLFPTLAELTQLQVPPKCPENPFKVDFCTEGASFAQLIEYSSENYAVQNKGLKIHREKGIPWKSAVFSQYPRPSDYPQQNTDLPSLKDIRIMGYTMRTHHHRYTAWVSFDPVKFFANFSEVHARELYLRDSDPLEIYNVANLKEYSNLVSKLHTRLAKGWRHEVFDSQ